MERFVFVAAIVVASFYAIGVMFGSFHDGDGDGWSFHINTDSGPPAELVALQPGAMAAQTFPDGDIDIRHTAARIVVIPEDRTDISVEIDNQAGATPLPTVEAEADGGIVIDGRLRGRIGGCEGETVRLRGYDNITHAQMAVITIRTPRTVDLDLGGANVTEIGATQALSVSHAGCGVTRAADVAGELDVDLAGSGEVLTGAANSLNADVAGSGRLSVGAVAAGANIDMAGSGTVEIASLTGALERDGAGSGDIFVRAGAITEARIRQAGSGDVELVAAIQTLDAAVVGSGDILVTGDVANAEARIMGSGNVTVRGTVGALDASIMGSGEFRATAITGAVTQNIRGSGRVITGATAE